ncbi:MAG: hypothetical protein C0426_11105 [Rhodobacter sp.]|nr:hypothetical protein [Rhodobacter sp.]MBS3979470.1 hypothetical protein [Paracoccaceae bacterium]
MTGDDEAWVPPDLSALGVDPAPQSHQMPDNGGATPAAAALARHHDALMARIGVVMVGETLDATGASAVLIGVRTARDMGRLPTSVDGVPVVVQVIGDVDAQ